MCTVNDAKGLWGIRERENAENSQCQGEAEKANGIELR